MVALGGLFPIVAIAALGYAYFTNLLCKPFGLCRGVASAGGSDPGSIVASTPVKSFVPTAAGKAKGIQAGGSAALGLGGGTKHQHGDDPTTRLTIA